MAASALVALGALAAPAQATFPGKNGKIAYSTIDHSSPINAWGTPAWDVFAIAQDGTGAQKLLGPHDTSPAWAPGGRKLAFHRRNNTGTSHDIWTANADGSGQVQVTDHTARDQLPGWSPDGRKIVFSSTRDGTSLLEIYVMNADGSKPTRLTNDPGNDIYAAFSPDGRKIAFARTFQEHVSPFRSLVDVWTMNANGTGTTKLTTDGTSSSPNWSPDGKTIAYNKINGGLRLMDADGANKRDLATPTGGTGSNGYVEWSPAWSPDGNWIAFTRIPQEGNTREELFLVDPEGTREIRLTTNPDRVFHQQPDWQALPQPKPKALRRMCLWGFCFR